MIIWNRDRCLRAPVGDGEGGGGSGDEGGAGDGGGADDPPAPEPEPEPEPPPPQKGTPQHLPPSAASKVRADGRRQGRETAFSEVNAKAVKLGYRDWDDMVARTGPPGGGSRAPAKEPPAPDDETPPAPPAAGGSRTNTRLEKEILRLTEDRRRANRRAAAEERGRREAERLLVRQEALGELRLAAVQAGVRDVDYAVTLLERRLAGRTEKELEGFDEAAFFTTDLRASHPFLYGVVEKPADSSAGGGDGDTRGGAPPPKPLVKKGEGDPPMDARKLSREDYEKELRRRGLSPPGFGMPGG
jgi:hypothetical protein